MTQTNSIDNTSYQLVVNGGFSTGIYNQSVLITTSSDTTYYIAESGNEALAGTFYLNFHGSQRQQDMMICCSCSPFDSNGSLSVIYNHFYDTTGATISSPQLVRDTITGVAYLTVVISNRNSGTALTVSYLGPQGVVLAPSTPSNPSNMTQLGMVSIDSPTASSASTTFNTGLSINGNGVATNTLQPCFLATEAATQSNVTGDGTTVTVQFTTEVFDQASNYDGTSTFTAPVTGRYRFSVSVAYNGLTASHTDGALLFVTTARTYYVNSMNYGAVRQVSNGLILNGTVLADMTAGDTCIVQTEVSNGTKVVDLGGGVTVQYFAGELVC